MTLARGDMVDLFAIICLITKLSCDAVFYVQYAHSVKKSFKNMDVNSQFSKQSLPAVQMYSVTRIIYMK